MGFIQCLELKCMITVTNMGEQKQYVSEFTICEVV